MWIVSVDGRIFFFGWVRRPAGFPAGRMGGTPTQGWWHCPRRGARPFRERGTDGLRRYSFITRLNSTLVDKISFQIYIHIKWRKHYFSYASGLVTHSLTVITQNKVGLSSVNKPSSSQIKDSISTHQKIYDLSVRTRDEYELRCDKKLAFEINKSVDIVT